jgi:hypothetical protein
MAKTFNIPVLFGHIDLNLINPYSVEHKNEKPCIVLNVNGRERLNGEYNYPLYQDEFKLVGEVHTKNLGVVNDGIVIKAYLFMAEIDHKFITENKLLEIVVSSNKGKLYQTNRLPNDSISKVIGVVEYDYTENFKQELDSKNTEDYIDPQLPYSRFD